MTEAEFFAAARAFLEEVAETSQGPPGLDQDLLETGVLDSLRTIEFLAFVEEQRGAPLPPGLAGAAITLRGAYGLLVATADDR